MINLECLLSFLWDLDLKTDQRFQLTRHKFDHVHRGRDSFQLHLCLINQGQDPLHLRDMMRGGRLFQLRGIPPSIIPPVWTLFDNLLGLVNREHVCPHVFARVPPPLLQTVSFFVVFNVLLKYPHPPRPTVLPPLAVISAIDTL